MAELQLQRSVTSFRRQGSSGLIWDDKVVSGLGVGFGDMNQSGPKQEHEENDQKVETREARQSQSQSVAVGSIAMMERSRSEGARPYRTVTVAPRPRDPPSPKATCGLCGLFGKPVVAAPQSNSNSKSKSKSKSKKRR